MTDASIKEELSNKEEREFFGKKTPLSEMLPKKGKPEEEEEIVVETAEEEEDSPVAKKPEKVSKPTVDEDIDDDDDDDEDDDELTGYSEKVQKRINKLTWAAREAQRRESTAAALRDEAIAYARQVNANNQKQAEIISKGEAILIQRIKDRAKLMMEQSKAKYKEAYASGDADGLVAAQEEFNRALNENTAAEQQENEYQNRMKYQQQQQILRGYQQQHPQGQQPQPYIQQYQQHQQPAPQTQQVHVDDEAKAWGEKNPWFGFGQSPDHQLDMTSFVVGVHEMLKQKGVEINSPKYFKTIDAEVHKRFPERFKGQNTTSAPKTVVAGGSQRNNAGSPRTVKLNERQVALAKKLGISLQQYAAQVLKEGE